MASYEVVYFDLRGRAEPVRLLLALAKVPFTDTRLTFDDWPNHKPNAPLGQAPWLIERDGDRVRHIPQSQAMLRHLARVHGLYGANEAEALACDVVLETATDFRAASHPLRFGPGAKDADAKAKFLAETLPLHLNRLRALLAEARPWLAGERPSVADVVWLDFVDLYLGWEPAALAGAPDVVAHADKVRRLDGIAAYLDARTRAGK